MSINLGSAYGAILIETAEALKATEGLGKSLGSAFKTAGTVAAGAMAGVGAAVIGGAAASVNAFIPFEKQMAEVFTLLPGISESAMSDMTGQVLGFASEFGTLPEEVVPALYQALSAGVPADNVFEFLETAQMAAAGGVTDLTTAVDGISSVVNAYGADVIGAGEASDQMFTAVRLGKTTMEELASSLFNVTPTAAGLGVQFGDVTAALASLTSQGVPTSVATTQLRQLFVELSKEGGKAAETFQEMSGQTFSEFVSSGGSVADALALMEDAAAENDVAIQDMFGSVEAGSAALALTSDLKGFSDNIEAMATSAGATETAFTTMSDTGAFKIDQMKATFSAALTEIGGAFGPLIDVVLGFAQEHMPAIQEAVSAFASKLGEAAGLLAEGDLEGALTTIFGEEMGGKILSVVDAISSFVTWLGTLIQEHILPFLEQHGPLLMQILGGIAVAFGAFTIISTVVGWISGLVAAVSGVIATFSAAGTIIGGIVAILGGPLTLVIAAVSGLVALLALAWKNNWGDIQGKTQAVVEWIQDKVEAFLETIRGWWDDHGEKVIAIVTFLWDSLKKIFETAKLNLSDIVEALKALLTGDFEEAERKLKEIWERTWETIKEIATKLWTDYLKPAFEALWASLSTWWEDLKTDVQTWAENFMTAAKEKFEEFWETHVKQPFEDLWTAVSDWWGGLDEDIKQLAQDWMQWIKDALGEFWETYVKEPFDNLWTNIRTWVDEKVDLFKQIGRDVMQGIKDGLIEKRQEVIGWIETLVGDLIATVKRLLGIESPSKVFNDIGLFIMAGLINGINDMVNDLEDSANAVVAVLEAIFSNADITTGISSDFLDYFDMQLQDSVIKPMEDATAYIESIWSKVFSRLPEHLQGMIPENIGELSGQEIEQLIRDLRARWYTMDAQSNRELDAIMRTLGVRNQYEAEYLEYKEREAELARQQAELGFLQAQLDLLKLVQDAGLDASILDGLQLGLGASMEGVLQAMSVVTEALIQQAEEALGIASPSRVFRGIGEMVGRGLEMGLAQSMRTNLLRDRLAEMIRPLPGMVQESIDNSRRLAVYGGIFFNGGGREPDPLAQVQGMLSYG